MKLFKLCSPLIEYVCELRRISQGGVAPSMEEARIRINKLLQQAEDSASESAELASEFCKVRLPLLFYVDFMIKEGSFPFHEQWVELARDHKELSGDEKFFDLLDECLNDPSANATERIRIFYHCLGTGFDGCHKGQRDFIEREMRVCALRLGIEMRCASDIKLTKPAYEHTCRTALYRNPLLAARLMMAVSALIFALALWYNQSIFNNDTWKLTDMLSSTLKQGLQRSNEESLVQRFIDHFKAVAPEKSGRQGQVDKAAETPPASGGTR